MKIMLRQYHPQDIDSVIMLFRETIHSINAKDYTPEQLNAWAPQNIDAEKWSAKLSEHYTLVAECNNEICGFADIDATGYFDHLFVHKNFQNNGIATKLVAAIEQFAFNANYKRITVAVSITAKTFFLKQGYTIIKPQQITYNGQLFTNYKMEKRIS